ncbi:phosphatases II [Microthyrium microscopicum]|uniref:protein-tyrosine-phosphatase n=1 Tax=Microthyrium microscopicum TaxID=703497 RepID=A0A6A6UFX9_9PEZI|nr:phosphatases II [Microthyrium microscopicum]
MPRESGASPTKSSGATAVCYGQVIEFIQDKLYLASYTHPPTSHTPFPWPDREAKTPRRTHHKTSSRSTPVARPAAARKSIVYFSIDQTLMYNAFHADFGPLHIGHLYRFAITLHEVLADNPERVVVFWSYADSRRRANSAAILACYMVLIQNWPPHLALAPIAQMDPPCMPFRDAGYSVADFGLTIQDIVYGVWRAKEEKLITLDNFNLEEYETYERVENGDFNWISPSFIALASPQDSIQKPISKSDPKHATIPRTVEDIPKNEDMGGPFKNVLSYFMQRNVGLVVRLNDPLYSPSYFTANGIQHLDMIFDDGTCPTMPTVRKFIRISHDMINVKKKAIGVHCKAGLGRTGCLIGAYLIYRHGFTANEVIAFMRFMRPGMVVGPQQHWLHLNQNTFREWWFEDSMKEKMALLQPSTPPRSILRNSKMREASLGACTPPNAKRSALGEIHSNDHSPANAVDDAFLPAPTPGQPRKTSKSYGKLSSKGSENSAPYIHQDATAEIVAMQRHVEHASGEDSADELQVHMRLRRASRTPSAAQAKRRAASAQSGPGSVRKVSGRVGSLGNAPPVPKAKS